MAGNCHRKPFIGYHSTDTFLTTIQTLALAPTIIFPELQNIFFKISTKIFSLFVIFPTKLIIISDKLVSILLTSVVNGIMDRTIIQDRNPVTLNRTHSQTHTHSTLPVLGSSDCLRRQVHFSLLNEWDLVH